MSAIYKLPLVLEPQPEGGYTVKCPILPELVTEGNTPEEIQENVADALRAVLEIYEDEGRELPAELREVTDSQAISCEALVSLA